MNRAAAKKLALAGNLTARDLRGMIAGARGRGGFSRVNTAIPLERALDIYEAALAGRPDEQVLAGEVMERGKPRHSRDALIVQNILRDTGGRA